MAVSGMPGETFELTIVLDADDDIAGPQAALRSGRAGPRRVRPPGRTGNVAVPSGQRPRRSGRADAREPGHRGRAARSPGRPVAIRPGQRGPGGHRVGGGRLWLRRGRGPSWAVPNSTSHRLVRLGSETGRAGAGHHVDDHRDPLRPAPQPDARRGRNRAAGPDPGGAQRGQPRCRHRRRRPRDGLRADARPPPPVGGDRPRRTHRRR